MLLNHITQLSSHSTSFIFTQVYSCIKSQDNNVSNALTSVSYSDLLYDIGEGFGFWGTIALLVLWTINLFTFVLQYNKPYILGVKNAVAAVAQNTSVSILQYQYFLKYLVKIK